MSKHTPGPWKFGVRAIEGNGVIEKPYEYRGSGYSENPSIYGPDGMEVVGCDEYYVFRNEHDVRLIAAAPDLLEVLKDVLEVVEASDHWWMDVPSRGGFDAEKIRAAIAKATS